MDFIHKWYSFPYKDGFIGPNLNEEPCNNNSFA